MSPYLIKGPALVSFSGGRTSAYMLHEILRAHDGRLPDDVIVAFANTGRELPETLGFVHECGARWGVQIRWVEWRDDAAGFAEVSHNSASRNGEPFSSLIAKKRRLPNWQERWCTTFLKIKPMHALMRSALNLEPGQYAEMVGLRRDEPDRIENAVEGDARSGRRRCFPLSRAGVTKTDVMSFWSSQPFDLGIDGWEGNCDLCFATGRGNRVARLRRRPNCGRWWRDQEEAIGGQFDRRDSVCRLIDEADRSPDMFEDLSDDRDVECGLGGCDVEMAI